jgi:hypothetical protein
MSWGFWMPALLTSTSIRPKRWMVAATRPRTSTSLVTSPRSARALRPWPSISWTSACASASRAIIVHDQQAPLAIQEGERGALPDGDPAVPADRAHARRQRSATTGKSPPGRSSRSVVRLAPVARRSSSRMA